MAVVRRYALLVGILVVVGVLAFVFRDRIQGQASDLAVGDCFDQPAGLVDIKDVQHHPCTEAHTAEVFAIVSNPAAVGAPPPDTQAIKDFFVPTCLPLLSAYIGKDALSQTTLDFGAFFPNDEGWNKGNRAFTCYLYRLDEGPMSTSMKGAKP